MTTIVMRASQDQRARTKAEEGLRLAAYNDTVGISTIGWGHASVNPHPVRGLLNGEFYQGKPKAGVTITIQEAERLFDLDIDEIETGVSALVKQELSQSQFDALVDFCFQYGLDKFGTSDLVDKLNFNPNNTDAVFFQFMRWTRAGGDHQEYVWRRSARRCCIYNGSPIPQALWRKNGFPFATKKNEDGQIVIDYTITPTIEKIIAYGKKAAEKPVFDPSKPLPEAPPIEPLKPEVILAPKLPIPEELVLTIPAASDSGPDANGAELVRPDLPDVQAPKAEVNTNIGSSTPVSPESTTLDPTAPQPPRVQTPASPLPPLVIPAEKPKSPVDPDAQPEKKKDTMGTIAKDAGLDRSSVEKAITAWLIWLGNSLRSLGANGMKFFGLSGSSLSVIADQLQQPFVQIMVATAFFVCLTGGIWFVGVITEKGALKVKVKAERAEAAT